MTEGWNIIYSQKDIEKQNEHDIILIQESCPRLPNISNESGYSLASFVSFQNFAILDNGKRVNHFTTIAFDKKHGVFFYDDLSNLEMRKIGKAVTSKTQVNKL